MQLYTIRRRNAWKSADELQAAAARSKQVGDEEMSSDIRWIRSYVLEEDDGTLGTLCVYESSGPEAIKAHAARVGMPADEVVAVGDTVVVRPDPVAAGAA